MKSRNLTIGLFIFYFLALIWVVLCKMQFSLAQVGRFRSINWIPFAGSVIINGRISIAEILANVLVFVPYGLFTGVLMGKSRFLQKFAPIFFTSLLFELLQYAFALGATDITDLLGNTAGGILGIGLFVVLRKRFKERAGKAVNILAFCVAAVLLAAFGVLFAANR
ncbi:MAG: VanZ family protein [Eubacteriales bacterium]|nr:VanZ family protein [Eubacteriales bacterium]